MPWWRGLGQKNSPRKLLSDFSDLNLKFKTFKIQKKTNRKSNRKNKKNSYYSIGIFSSISSFLVQTKSDKLWFQRNLRWFRLRLGPIKLSLIELGSGWKCWVHSEWFPRLFGLYWSWFKLIHHFVWFSNFFLGYTSIFWAVYLLLFGYLKVLLPVIHYCWSFLLLWIFISRYTTRDLMGVASHD